MYDKKVLEKTGLQAIGKDEEGDEQYIGTQEQWENADSLQEAVDNATEDLIDNDLM